MQTLRDPGDVVQRGALRSTLKAMAESQKSVRKGVSLAVARRVQKLAFFELADRLTQTSDRTEQKRLKEEMARMTFGEPKCRFS